MGEDQIIPAELRDTPGPPSSAKFLAVERKKAGAVRLSASLDANWLLTFQRSLVTREKSGYARSIFHRLPKKLFPGLALLGSEC